MTMPLIVDVASSDAGNYSRINKGFRRDLWPRKHAGNFTAAPGYREMPEADASDCTMPSPADGDVIGFARGDAAVDTLNLIYDGVNKIDGVSGDYEIDFSRGPFFVVFDASGSRGWLVFAGAAASTAGILAWGGVQTGGFNAVANTVYVCNFSSATINYPASPTAGDCIELISYADTNVAWTIDPGAEKIDAAAPDYVTSTNRLHLKSRYGNSTVGWRMTGEEAGAKAAPSISAGALALDTKGGKVTKFVVSLNANVTSITYSNLPPNGVPYWGELEFTADGTARTIPADAATFRWPFSSPPTPSSTNGLKDRLGFYTDDGGTNVRWSVIGQAYAS